MCRNFRVPTTRGVRRRCAEQFIGGANGVNLVFLKFEFSKNYSKTFNEKI